MKCFSNGFLTRILSLLLICSMLSVSFGSAANARFIQPDTMDPTIEGVGTNRYAYAGNDPVNKSDPNGHLWGLVGLIGGFLGSLFGGTKEANAPGANDKISNTSDRQQMLNMTVGAAGGTLAGKVAGKAAQDVFGKKKENQKQAAETQQGSEISPSETSPDITIESKIENQMAKRGWDESSIRETISKPDRTVQGLKDTRFDPTTGARRSDPATGFVNKDGSYVVRNNTNGSIVQVSDRTNPGWKSPF